METFEAMTEEIDIYRAANIAASSPYCLMSKLAAQQADACLEKGDLDGKVVWLAVIEAIKELLDTSPPEDRSTLH